MEREFILNADGPESGKELELSVISSEAETFAVSGERTKWEESLAETEEGLISNNLEKLIETAPTVLEQRLEEEVDLEVPGEGLE